jgi:geranylgeranyl transferase type-2 subunit alpha
VKLFDGELALTQECLLGNPKSYSSWHHRFLMLGRHPRPELARELAMCERALAADCRNFHCWDHRRAVARMARLSDAEELEWVFF